MFRKLIGLIWDVSDLLAYAVLPACAALLAYAVLRLFGREPTLRGGLGWLWPFDRDHPDDGSIPIRRRWGGGGDFQLGAFFDDPHKNVAKMQRQTADSILGAVGAPYLPSRLLQLLKRHDAFQASDRFLRALGMDYATLLGNKREREYLGRVVIILVEVDALLRDSQLSDQPLYDLIATRPSDEVLEARVERLRKVAAIVAAVRARRITFPEYHAEFVPQAVEATRRWEVADDALISELHTALLEWEEAQEQYERLNSEIAELARLIRARAPAAAAARLTPIIETAERIRRDTESGKIPAAVALEDLKAVLEEIRRVYESIPGRAGGRAAGGGRAGAGAGGRAEAEAHLRTLGLTYPGDLNHTAVKRAFRNLAHRHHPDKPGGDEKKFIKFYAAYDWLMKYIDRRGSSA